MTHKSLTNSLGMETLTANILPRQALYGMVVSRLQKPTAPRSPARLSGGTGRELLKRVSGIQVEVHIVRKMRENCAYSASLFRISLEQTRVPPGGDTWCLPSRVIMGHNIIARTQSVSIPDYTHLRVKL